MKLEGFSIYRPKREEQHDEFQHHPSSFAAAPQDSSHGFKGDQMWLPFAANPCDCLLLPTHVVAFWLLKNEFSEPVLV
ncbi:hypothetical protein ACE6H2_023098 [Prunus campanulata]